MIETHTYARKPFHVDAVQVTPENMNDLSAWCEGEIHNTGASNAGQGVNFIKVQVHRPLTERQTRAFVGDWILYAGSGFKVYTTKAFENSFEQGSTDTVVHEVPDAAETEDANEEE